MFDFDWYRHWQQQVRVAREMLCSHAYEQEGYQSEAGGVVLFVLHVLQLLAFGMHICQVPQRVKYAAAHDVAVPSGINAAHSCALLSPSLQRSAAIHQCWCHESVNPMLVSW